MIKVAKGHKPEILAQKADEWTRDYLDKVARYNSEPTRRHQSQKKQAEKRYRHRQIKEALKTDFASKCAYCESYIAHIDYGDIEHFRPKSKFPELCFNWDNLLLSCGICNDSAHKGDFFPGAAEGGPLINPTEEEPAIFFKFEFDAQTGVANVIPVHQRGHITERLLGLNRKDLIQHRSSVVGKMAYVAIKASQGDAEALHLFRECCNPRSEYSAFATPLAHLLGIELS